MSKLAVACLKGYLADYVDGDKVDELVRTLAKDFILRSECEGQNREYQEQKDKIKTLNDRIAGQNEALTERMDVAESYLGIIKDRDKKIAILLKSPEPTAIPVQCAEEVQNYQQDIDQLQKNIVKTKADKGKAEEDLVKAKESIAVYKKKLGLGSNASDADVEVKINELIQTNEVEAREYKECIQREKQKVSQLEKTVSSLQSKNEDLHQDLRLKKTKLEALMIQAVPTGQIIPSSAVPGMEKKAVAAGATDTKCAGCGALVPEPIHKCICGPCYLKLQLKSGTLKA